jgi:hypothetical protein
MDTLRNRIDAYLAKHGAVMHGKKARGLYRRYCLGGINIEDGVTSVTELRAAIPKRIPHNTEIEYYWYQDECGDNNISLKFMAEEPLHGDKREKLRRGIERIQKKYLKEHGTLE